MARQRLWSGLYLHHFRRGTYSLYGSPHLDNLQNQVSSVLPSPTGKDIAVSPIALRFHRYSALHFASYLFLTKAPRLI